MLLHPASYLEVWFPVCTSLSLSTASFLSIKKTDAAKVGAVLHTLMQELSQRNSLKLGLWNRTVFSYQKNERKRKQWLFLSQMPPSALPLSPHFSDSQAVYYESWASYICLFDSYFQKWFVWQINNWRIWVMSSWCLRAGVDFRI